jgi:hypothetical protein
MRDRVSMVLRTASHAVVLLGFLALACVREYGTVMILPPLAFIALAGLGERLERDRPGFRTLKRALCITYGCFIPLSLFMLGLMQAVIALVIFIQGWLMIGEKTGKSWYQIHLMSFFLLLAAVVQRPEPGIALVLAGFVVAVIWAFVALRIQVERGAMDRIRPARVADLSGVLRSGGAQSGSVFDAGLFGALALLSVVALLLTVGLFLATPRVEAGLFGREDRERAVTGLTDTVRLAGGMSIYQDQRAVMRVEFPDEPEGVYAPAGQLYWRVTTLSRFSGSEWSRLGLQDHHVPGVAPVNAETQTTGKEEERSRREGTRLVHQVIFLDDTPTAALPCLDLVQSVRLPEETKRMSVHWDPNLDLTMQLETRGPRRLSYDAYSEVVSPTEDQLRGAKWDYAANLPPHDLQLLTYHELLPATRRLVDPVVRGKQSPYEVMLALEAWLSGPDFLYTLDLPPLPASNGIDYFLTKTRRGHCELFASALALMARSRGIPARVVSGYRGGDFSPIDRAYSVRASMAHLWVEAYFNGLGWVRFDPSPQTDLDTTRLGTLRAAISRQMLRGKMFWYQSVMGFQGGWRLDRLFGRGGALPNISQIAGSGAAVTQWLPRGGGVLIPLGVAMALPLILVRLLRARRRERRFPLTPDQARAARLHRGLVRRLERLGIPCSGRVVEEIADAVQSCSWLDRATVLGIINAYDAARFGGRPMNRTQYAALCRTLSGVRILR